jgi:hypothetical protein
MESDGMKTTLRSLFFVLLAVGGMALLAGYARGTDETLPPEVKALIGINLPPVRVEGKDIKMDPRLKPLPSDYVRIQPASIPGWKYRGGGLLTKSPQSEHRMGLEELYRGDLSIFVIDQIDENDKSKTILDAQVLPQKLLLYYVKNGEVVEKKQGRLYEISEMCEREDAEIIVGLMRPEAGKEDCQHKTTQVIRAWKIDSGSGRVTAISTHGVACLVPAGNTCH